MLWYEWGSYLSAELQLAYSIVPADWVMKIIDKKQYKNYFQNSQIKFSLMFSKDYLLT